MAGLVARLPAPCCHRALIVPGCSRLSSSGIQSNRVQRAPLSGQRQQRVTPSRVQRLTVSQAAAAAADTALAAEAHPTAVAHLRFQRGSPHKVRRVLDQIRGRSYEEALILLEYMPYRACEPILDTLISAASNAKNNLGLRKSRLYVKECTADGGPVLKRIRPRAKGRGARILKPTFHLSIKVAERKVPNRKVDEVPEST